LTFAAAATTSAARADREIERRRRRLAIRRRFFPRGLTFTREGRVYVVVTLGVGFAAVNTGNNLLYLVLGMMLGLIVISGVLSEIALRGVSVRRVLGRRAVEGEVFPVELTLRNDKRRNASFSVELRDEIDGAPFKRRCFFLRVGPNEERSIAYRCELHRRGRRAFDGIVVSTRFPFGLFEKTRFFGLAGEVLVLPALIDVATPRLADASHDGAGSVERRGLGQEFRELRAMVPGDDPRRIDWRSTARLGGEPLIRETDREVRGFVEIALDAAVEADTPAARAEVEQRIRAAGTLVRDLARRGFAVALVTSGRSEAAPGSADAAPLLDALALLDPFALAAAPPPVAVAPGAILIGPRASALGPAVRVALPAAPEVKA
jgi:uncharacterized protein (DUF58 family)